MKISKKQKSPKVSFIIPTLNASHFLPQCLTAITSQNYPQDKIEIIIADGGSTDSTLSIAKKFHAKVITNPEVLHEQGKTRAAKIATGEILFYTDADNILSHTNWIRMMVKPYLDTPTVLGFLPQTIPAPDSNPLDRYLGYLCTDPFTWFIYEGIASGREFPQKYLPVRTSDAYLLYKFHPLDPPLIGFSQGAGTSQKFKRGKIGHADDLLAAIKMMEEDGIIAYIPNAGVYHYHVSGLNNFIKKYSWRIKNNLEQHIRGMGVMNRKKYFSTYRKIRMALFIPYGLSLFLPAVDSTLLVIKHKDPVMLWHIPASFLLSFLIIFEYVKSKVISQRLGTYE